MTDMLNPLVFGGIVVGALLGILLGWSLRGRSAKGREMTLKREYDNKLSLINEDSSRSLERARAASDTRVRQLERERDRLRALLSGREVDDTKSRKRRVPPETGEREQDGDAGEPDDFTKIKGIGPAFDARLKEMGYTRYEDIAGWSSEDIERLSPELGARVRLEEWSEAAAKLLRGD